MRAPARPVRTDDGGAKNLRVVNGDDARAGLSGRPHGLRALGSEVVWVGVRLAVSDDVAEERPDLLPVLLTGVADLHAVTVCG
jgi:hypothetical protein